MTKSWCTLKDFKTKYTVLKRLERDRRIVRMTSRKSLFVLSSNPKVIFVNEVLSRLQGERNGGVAYS